MKYRYTRKEIVKMIKTKCFFGHNESKAVRWLLATQPKTQPTKEDRKECIHEGDKTDWHPQFCRKCGAEFMYDFSTPSPLEIEDIETLKHRFMSGKNHCWRELSLQDQKINSLIRNQKKLYQLIKEKL